MTATYDGHLVLRGKTIEPCCATMHSAVFSDVVYAGTKDKRSVIVLRLGDKKGAVVQCCPFCGASAEVSE